MFFDSFVFILILSSENVKFTFKIFRANKETSLKNEYYEIHMRDAGSVKVF